MECTKTINGNEVVLSFKGRIDTTTAGEFENAVNAEINQGVSIIIDFSQLEYISSAGLRVLLSMHKKISALNGKLIVKNANDDVLEIFDITGFSNILNIEK